MNEASSVTDFAEVPPPATGAPNASAPSLAPVVAGGRGRWRAFAADVWAVLWRAVVLLILAGLPLDASSTTPLELLGWMAISVLCIGWITWRGDAVIRRALGDRAPTLPWRISRREALGFAVLGIVEAVSTVGLVDAMALDPVGGVELDDPDLHQPLAVLQFFLAPVLLAPVAEELMFRGLLQGMFAAWARPLLAYAATAACFAAMHGTSDIFWLYLGSSFVWSHVARHRGVVATATIHAGYNGILIIGGMLALIAGDATSTLEAETTRAFRTPMASGVVASLWVLSLALMWRRAAPLSDELRRGGRGLHG